MPTNDENEFEVVRGADAIGKIIGEKTRRTFALLEAGVLPCWKELGIWTTTRGRLRQHYLREKHPKAKRDGQTDIATQAKDIT